MVGKTVTHYRILRELGRGGMGEVYEAEDLSLRRRVALKFLTEELAAKPEAVERFQREARMASALNHPHICIVHEIGESQGQHFIVTELLQGHTLRQLLASGPVEARRAQDLALQIADGLAAAHARGIVHRDLKPSNIFITEQGQVKLLDFGLAKPAQTGVFCSPDASTMMEGDLTSAGMFVGTLSYMSPEQLRSMPASPASDVFSFGIVLHEMLTGVHPFAKKTVFETASSILSDVFPAIDASALRVPEPWLVVLRRMLSKKQAERYTNAEDVRIEILKLGGSQELVTPPRPRESPVAKDSIAVLPFRNLSRDPENEYFSDGLAEELINLLGNVSDLRVSARSSSFRFRGKEIDIREIGRELAVSSILDGGVQRSGNRIRITAQLVNVSDGFQLWSGKYDRELSDMFALQDDIAQAVVASLESALTGNPVMRGRRISPEAYTAYLQGRFFWNKRTAENFRKAIECFHQAISLESGFAAALAGIADCYITLAIYGAEPPEKVIPLARQSAHQALEIDPKLAEAHTSLGGVAALYDWDWKGAEKHFQRAIESSPRYATAHHWYASSCLIPQAKFGEARREVRVALELEPLSLAIGTTLGGSLFLERQYDEAVQELTKIIAMDRNFGLAHFFLGQAYVEKAAFDDAIRELQTSTELNGRSPESVAILAWAYGRAGKAEESRQILNDLRGCAQSSYVSPVLLAQVALGLGEKNEALGYLDQAYNMRAADLVWLKVRPAFDELREEPRFIKICRAIGLVS